MRLNNEAGRGLVLRHFYVIVILAGSMALLMTSSLMIMPLFAHRFSDFSAGVRALGLSSLAAALAGAIAAPFTGVLADRIGRRPVILALAALQVLTTAGLLVAGSPRSYILLCGLGGACSTGIIPAIMGTVADLAPSERRAQYIGIVNGGSSAGWMIGPILGGFLYDHWGYQMPFSVSIAVALLALFFVMLLVPETRGVFPMPAAAGQVTRDASVFVNSRSKVWMQFSILLAISFILLFAWAFIEPQFMFYSYDEMHWTSSQLGIIISIYGMAITLGELTLGRLSDRFGRKPALVLGLVMSSAQYLGLAQSHQYLWIACSFIVAGLGNAIYDPALGALFLDLAPHGFKSRIMGLRTTASSLGSMAGPALLVLVTPYMDSHGIFAFSLILVLVMAMVTTVSLSSTAPQDGLRGSQPGRETARAARLALSPRVSESSARAYVEGR